MTIFYIFPTCASPSSHITTVSSTSLHPTQSNEYYGMPQPHVLFSSRGPRPLGRTGELIFLPRLPLGYVSSSPAFSFSMCSIVVVHQVFSVRVRGRVTYLLGPCVVCRFFVRM